MSSGRQQRSHIRGASWVPLCGARKPAGGWLFAATAAEANCKDCRKKRLGAGPRQPSTGGDGLLVSPEGLMAGVLDQQLGPPSGKR